MSVGYTIIIISTTFREVAAIEADFEEAEAVEADSVAAAEGADGEADAEGVAASAARRR